MDNDGHDQVWSAKLGLSKAWRWLGGFLEFLRLYKEAMKATLIVVTFDESRTPSAKYGNRIYRVFLGAMVKPWQQGRDAEPYSRRYNHYNLLRTIEDNFGLGHLYGAAVVMRPSR